MMPEKNLQLYFKEFVKAESLPKGIEKIDKTPDYVCDLFVYEPRNVEEARLGTLFMLGKIENIPENKYKNFDFLLSLLISVIKREFYSDFKRPASEALESSLNKANLYLADFAEKGNIEWIGNLNFICGAFSKNNIHIAQTGNPMIKLFRETAISHIERKFPTQKRLHPLKTFGNIASGTMLDGDKIILGLKDVLDVVPLATLKTLSQKSCNQIIETLKRMIGEKTDKTPIICLVLETKEEGEEIPISKPAEPELVYRIKQSRIKPIIIKPLLAFKKILVVIFLIIYKIFLFLAFIFKKLYQVLAPLVALPLLLRIFPRIKNPFSKLIKKSRIEDKYHKIKKQIINFKNCKIKALYQQNRPAFVIACLLIILILILPFSVTQTVNYYINLNNFNKLTAEIEEVQKKTDLALIYQDKNKASGLLQKNQILMANLFEYFGESPLKNNERVLNKITVLQQKNQEQQDNINNVKRIEELETILDFSTSGFIVNPAGMSKIKNNFYFYELDSGILYTFNLDIKEKPLTLVFISAKDELRKMVSLENNKIVLFGQSGKTYLYDINANEHNIYLLDPAVPAEEIKDVKSFLSNFYILDAKGNIIKYSQPRAGPPRAENKGNNWLSEPTEELKNAQSMTIDGSIYILNSNGLINKYYGGEKVEEIQSKLEKALGENSKIFTADNFIHFYISDPKNKRLIILNKQGEAINQYVHDEFVNLSDFWVTADEKEAYLLCGKKVYKFGL